MTVEHRAYSVFDVKSIDEDLRVLEGIATTPTADRIGDIVESEGAQFKMPLPLLWQHKSDQPVGHVEIAKVNKNGISFKARIAKIEEAGELKNMVDKAWQAVKAKLVRGVSIGFRALETEPLDKDDKFGWGPVRFKKWEWLELSVVTIPANQDASIQTIRSIDADALKERNGSTDVPAAIGKKHDGSLPGDSGKRKSVVKLEARKMAKKSTAEQISAFETTRAARAARMSEIMEKASEEGVTLDDEQKQEYDNLEIEMKSIDDHLVRLHRFEDVQRATSVAVVGNSQQNGSESRAGVDLQTVRTNPIISVRHMLPPGIGFARLAIAKAMAMKLELPAYEVAKQRWPEEPHYETILKAAVLPGTTTDSTWAAPLINYQVLASEFLEFLRPLTVIGRIPGMRRVPFNIQIPSQTAGSLAQWVGEMISKPVSALAFTSITLRWAKVANIIVLTDELVRFSNPAAEAIVRDDLADGVAQFLDQQFLTPSVTEVTNVSPASITNGAPNSAASGTTADNVRTDFKTVIASFASANIPFSGIVMLMNTNLAASLGMMHNALGQPEFPTLSGDGGSIMGIPVVVSDNVPSATVIFVKASEILIADDGGVDIAVSREASLQLDSNPSEPPTTMVSLFQQNAVALRAERYINWKRRRTQSVYYLTSVNYGTVVSA
jgi:HK97 family phage major capsid protein/HK97 family phage prohead protease